MDYSDRTEHSRPSNMDMVYIFPVPEDAPT